MEKLTRIHFRLAVLFSLLLAGYFALTEPALSEQLLWLLLLAGLIGIPHGLTDWAMLPALASRLGLPPQHTTGAGIYLLLMAAYLAFWWQFPIPAFLLFLLLAMAHFGWQDIAFHPLRFRAIQAWLRGSMVIVLPYLAHPETAEYFNLLTQRSFFAAIYEPLLLWGMAALYLLASLLTQARAPLTFGKSRSFMQWTRKLVYFSETLLLLLIFIYLPPLLSFTIYFTLWHTPRHYLAMQAWLPRYLSLVISVFLLLLLIATGALLSVPHAFLRAEAGLLIQSFFMLLAALTAAHVAAHRLANTSINPAVKTASSKRQESE